MIENIASPLLCLPAEIRLQIYGYLLVPPPLPTLASTFLLGRSEYHHYEKPAVQGSDSDSTLHMRIIDPQRANLSGSLKVLSTLKRSKCLIRTDRFRARTMQTTYTASNNPGIEPSILATCKLIYAEAAEVLYTSYTFDFDTHVEAIGAFLADLTPLSRSFVRSVSLVKRATPYDRDFDRCEWSAATTALCQLPSIRTLNLGVVAGKPGLNGWEGVPIWTKEDFNSMVKWRSWAGLEWVGELAKVQIREGGQVQVKAIIEHCPMPSSEGMAFWIGVSRNVDGGFGEWVSELMSNGRPMM